MKRVVTKSKILNARSLGVYRNPTSKRKIRVFAGTCARTGRDVNFTESDGKRKIIPEKVLERWVKIPIC